MAKCTHVYLELLSTILFLLRPAFSFEIEFSTVQSCKDSDKYFQVSNLQCVACDGDKEVSSDGLSCTCKLGYFITEYFGGPTITCSLCGSNKVTSSDKWFCVSCQSGIAVGGRCDPCPKNQVAVDRDLNGTIRSARLCLECVRGTSLQPTGGQCKRCPSCELSFSSVPTSRMFEITYDNGVELESAFFFQNFVIAKNLCKDKQNYTACQLLGNLCVMLDYKVETGNACGEYLDLVDNPPGGQKKVQSKEGVENANWLVHMPWLYYLNNQNDANVELNSEDIATEFKKGQSLGFVLAIYAANGTFLDLKMDIDELQMCQDRPSRLAAADTFATIYENSCHLPLNDLWQQENMKFYDLYFKSSSDTLYAVPLVVENFEERGSFVNEGDSFKSWKLHRRFFLVDNVSGKRKPTATGTTVSTTEDQVIRIAEKMEIILRLRNDKGQIFPPFVRIKYKTLTVNDDILKRNPDVSVSFKVDYQMDISSINSNIKVIIINIQVKIL